MILSSFQSFYRFLSDQLICKNRALLFINFGRKFNFWDVYPLMEFNAIQCEKVCQFLYNHQ